MARHKGGDNSLTERVELRAASLVSGTGSRLPAGSRLMKIPNIEFESWDLALQASTWRLSKLFTG